MISQKYSVSQNMLRNNTTAFLNREGIGSVFVSSPEEATALLKSLDNGNTKHIDLVILALPNLRKQQLQPVVDKCILAKIPTLAIVPLDNVGDLEVTLKITELITSPVYDDELVVRAKRAISRHEPSTADDVIVRDDLIINPANYEVTVKGKRVDLRFKEYELLLVLSSNPGRVYDRATLLNQIWGYDYFGGTRTVDVHIRRLRSKIENNPDAPYIETIWNVGYRFRSLDSV